MINFTYTTSRETYTIINNESVPISYTISRVNCEGETLVKTCIIPANKNSIINFKTDGDYKIVIKKGNETQELPVIKNYKNLLTTILDSFLSLVCGCGCDDCQDCGDTSKSTVCNEKLNLLLNCIAYDIINTNDYLPAIHSMFSLLRCEFTDTVLCSLTQKMLTGNQETNALFNKIISSYYYAFYYYDYTNASTEDEKLYIKEKYRYNEFIKCIKKQGISNLTPEIIMENCCNDKVKYLEVGDALTIIPEHNQYTLFVDFATPASTTNRILIIDELQADFKVTVIPLTFTPLGIDVKMIGSWTIVNGNQHITVTDNVSPFVTISRVPGNNKYVLAGKNLTQL